jgi:Cd2+/Zn2+-exporting ATPase
VSVDGVVRGGQSAVDQAAITGESVPVDKSPGDAVFAGTVNTFGALEVEVTRLAADNTLSRMIRAGAGGAGAHSHRCSGRWNGLRVCIRRR